MKLFITRVALFFGIIFVPLLLLSSYLFIANANKMNDFASGLRKSVIVIGDSHTQKAINEIYWPAVINLSQSSECYIYSYVKLYHLLTGNPGIKTVILGCSYHSFSAYYDEFVFGAYSADISSRYFFIMPDSLRLQFLYQNRNRMSRYFQKVIENGIANLRVSPAGYSFLGHYETYATKVKLSRETVRKRIETHYYHKNELNDFSMLNIFYLEKIIDLCRNRNTALVLLNTPMHKYYLDQVPVKFKKKYDSLVKTGNLNVIEFEDLRLPDSCFLPDGDHVTDYGAHLTTMFLADYLKNYTP